jgi:hypothetical protein
VHGFQLSKVARLSSRIFDRVLNSAVYDADCCPTARNMLAVGDVDGAIAEWRRRADLGSGPARCILSYLHLMGAPSIPVDLDEAKRLASSAIAGDRGYACYLLGCIALQVKDPSSAVKALMESQKAKFTPALTMLASLLSASADVGQKRKAAAMFHRAAAAGHVPARLMLATLYLSGRLGLLRRLVGLGLLPIAFIWYSVGLRHRIFSINYFQYFSNSRVSLFKEASASRLQGVGSTTADGGYIRILRWTHVLAGIVVAGVLVSQVDTTSHWSGGLCLLALYPYGLSYWIGSMIEARSRTVVTLQTVLMLIVTILTCDAYTGRLLDMPLTGLSIGLISLTQTLMLVSAYGVAVEVAKRFVHSDEATPAYRSWIFGAHAVLGTIAAGAVFVRPGIWTGAYLQRHGIDLVTNGLIAALPFGLCAAFSWGLVTTNRWRPWAYVMVLIAGAVISVFSFTGDFVAHWGMGSVIGLAMIQLLIFCLAAEWALDGTEW